VKLLLTLLATLGVATSASAEQQFEFSSFDLPGSGRIVIPVALGETLNGVAATVDSQTNGALTVAAGEAAFIGEAGTSLTLYGVAPYSRIDLIGVGGETLDRVDAEDFGGTAAGLLAGATGGSVQILWPAENSDAAATAARVAFG